MLPFPFSEFRYILASASPRRQQLLTGMGFPYTLDVRDIDEVVPAGIKAADIALFLSKAKSDAFSAAGIAPGQLVITADTIVWQNGHMLGKPRSAEEAYDMIMRLSGTSHEVFTAVTLKTAHQQHSFCDRTEVFFRTLTDNQVRYYIETCSPYDKAGAYGVQEWIGYVAVEKIIGSFYNVMGFPTQKFYPETELFLETELCLLSRVQPNIPNTL